MDFNVLAEGQRKTKRAVQVFISSVCFTAAISPAAIHVVGAPEGTDRGGGMDVFQGVSNGLASYRLMSRLDTQTVAFHFPLISPVCSAHDHCVGLAHFKPVLRW